MDFKNNKKAGYTLRELKSKKEMLAQFALIKQLNTTLKQNEYQKLLTNMLKQNYRMIGVFENNKCIGISGFWIGTKIYSGKYLEPDNVVVDKNYRSKGIGKLLSNWLLKEAKKNKCKTIMLDAYLENESGHRFYLREGFTARGYHFIKKL